MNPSVMASPFVSKAFIPDLSSNVPLSGSSNSGASGFSFIGGGGSGATNKDSFQFVADEMKASKK